MQLPVLAATRSQVLALGVAFTPAAEALARWWWPGPLTLALGFADGASRPAWLEGRQEVAVRIPDHDFLRALLERTGVLVVTSANPHGAPTPRTAEDVAASLGPTVDLLVDGGRLPGRALHARQRRAGEPVVEREGAISRAEVAGALADTP